MISVRGEALPSEIVPQTSSPSSGLHFAVEAPASAAIVG
jgi:hypothetical protein